MLTQPSLRRDADVRSLSGAAIAVASPRPHGSWYYRRITRLCFRQRTPARSGLVASDVGRDEVGRIVLRLPLALMPSALSASCRTNRRSDQS
jgi:hypothetical protein